MFNRLNTDYLPVQIMSGLLCMIPPEIFVEASSFRKALCAPDFGR